jgi:hypothetical protein
VARGNADSGDDRPDSARAFIKGKTIREIARDLVSRNTVRKVLRSGETAFEYERNVQPRPKLGRWSVEVDELLISNASKSARERLTLIRIFEQLRERGYEGGYDAVRRYARRWAKQHGQATAAAYVPLSFAPGEAYQFDWSHEVVLLSGVTDVVSVLEALPGLTSTAIRTALGTRWCSRPSRLATTSEEKKLTPVGLPPGRAKLATRPNLTGSSATPKTIGIVVVAALATGRKR